ncbi:MAG: cofactor-independent phosphoglycerate mutase [Dehalococcoidaceae bacterium]|nr:cofactor-independent phosphoglycerate mutase [Dehalococcoidaceae bacterium]
MKYAVLIVDGAAGLPIPGMGGKTCLELAGTPGLDRIAREGRVGLARTVPDGMEPSSACACMSVMGYDPVTYYKGRAAIEAVSLDIPVEADEAVFRCNLVNTDGGIMHSYCAGHISTPEAVEIIESLNRHIGSENVHFYPGVGYRHILKLKGCTETLAAVTTPPHDISNKPIAGYLPRGNGSRLLLELIELSKNVLAGHPVNIKRASQGKIPATSIWLTWGSGPPPHIPPFITAHGIQAAITSGVDLLNGLGKMMSLEILDIPGVTDGQDNDCIAQVEGAIKALERNDLVIIHFEAPDEAGHAGSADQKIAAIQKADREMVSRLADYLEGKGRLLVMPDHPTPINLLTHTPDPVPFLIWGSGIRPDSAMRFTEAEGLASGTVIDPGWKLMGMLLGKQA